MKVVVVEPNKPAYIKEIDGGLKSMQSIVGGLLEPIYFLNERGVVMVGNEEAKLIGLPGNRRFPEGIVAGTFFICGDNGEDFCSLSVRNMPNFSKHRTILLRKKLNRI